jgi:Protein of unknown function (DUF3024)
MTMDRTIIPELELARIRRFADQRVPARARDQVRLEVEVGRSTVTIVEQRAPWRPEYGPDWTRMPIANLRYSERHHGWSLFWADRHGAWHRYSEDPPMPHVLPLLDEIERDPRAVFWGDRAPMQALTSDVHLRNVNP